MAEPTSAFTMQDLMVRVAQEIGCAYYGSAGSSGPMVPVDDRANFLACLGIVQRGIKLFVDSPPDEGWFWRKRLTSVTFAPAITGTASSGGATTLVDDSIEDVYDDDYFNGYTIRITAGTGVGETATVTDYAGSSGTFTFAALSGGSTPDSTSGYTISRSTDVINAEAARYLLPQDFDGTPMGQPIYAASTNHSTRMTWCNEDRIRSRRAITVVTGYPVLAAIRPYGVRRFEMIVDPEPSAADTIEFPYLSHFDNVDMEGGTATGGTAVTLVDTSLLTLGDYADDYFNAWVITILDGTGKGETATVTDWDHDTSTFTFTALSGGSTPDTTSVYIVQPASNKHPAGPSFDTAILHACLAQAYMEEDSVDTDWEGRFFDRTLPLAYRKDRQQRGMRRRLGQMWSEQMRPVERIWNDVQYDTD